MITEGQNVYTGVHAPLTQSPHGPQPSGTTAKLPKLEVKKFVGKLQEWQEFWDAFESAIVNNKSLVAVDKFTYLRSLLVEPVRSTITGFSLTSANYPAAVEVLKKRYGKETAIKRAHVKDLLNLPKVFHDEDTTRLRKLYDGCESHFRGLKALGVDESTYSAVVVSAVLNKLPEVFRLTITRRTDFLSWDVEEMLEAFSKQLVLRENHDHAVSANAESQDPRHSVFRAKEHRMRAAGGSTTLYTRQEVENCALCLGKHTHEYCTKVRVLFDAGSHRSFVTVRVAQYAQLSVIRREWLGISAFGQTSGDMQLRDVVHMEIARLGREPEVLVAHAAIIKDQLEAGIIEKVVELERASNVHYLPHQAVTRTESTTTKIDLEDPLADEIKKLKGLKIG
ncbi:uncharacterized protein [Montipora foliosa]|uniref:uncharacterized protein n=1 Tax=Montipora foliosa TaxID=591990 RepID=UPI0035F19B07